MNNKWIISVLNPKSQEIFGSELYIFLLAYFCKAQLGSPVWIWQLIGRVFKPNGVVSVSFWEIRNSRGGDNLRIGCEGWGRFYFDIFFWCVSLVSLRIYVYIGQPLFIPTVLPSKLLLKFRSSFRSSTKVVAVLAQRWFPLGTKGLGGWQAP